MAAPSRPRAKTPSSPAKSLLRTSTPSRPQHIIGGIKHFSFNDQESGRTTANAIIDERGGRESDLLAFEIGVKDSNVQSVMCSYNLTNGQYDCENSHLLNEVLKGDWAFPGFVMSDWWATHSTATAAINGLDQEQPNQQYFSTLGTAITGGQVPQSRLDNMVHRILRAMYDSGHLRQSAKHPAHSRRSRRGSCAGD